MLTPAMRSIAAAAIFLIFSDLYAAPPIYKLQTGLGGAIIDNDAGSFYRRSAAKLRSRGFSGDAVIEPHAEISSYEYPGNNDIDGHKDDRSSGYLSGNDYSVGYFHRF